MEMEKMTTALQQAIAEAQRIAMVRKHQTIDVAHLWKIFLQPDSFARNFYIDSGVAVEAFESAVDKELDKSVVIEGTSVQYGQTFSQNLYNLFLEADRKRSELKDDFVSTDTVLLSLMTLKNHPLTKFLGNQGLTEKMIAEKIKDMRGGERVTSQNQEDQYEALEKYGIDLVQAVRSGKQDPVIGRDEDPCVALVHAVAQTRRHAGHAYQTAV